MDSREVKACEMTGDQRIRFADGAWQVHSQTASRYYQVNPSPTAPACECDDFALHGSGTGKPCKHILAVRLLLERQLKGEPNPDTGRRSLPAPAAGDLPAGLGQLQRRADRTRRTIFRCFWRTCAVGSSSRRRIRRRASAASRWPTPCSPPSSRSTASCRPGGSCPTSANRTSAAMSGRRCFNSVLRVLELEDTTPILMAMIRQ